MITASERFVIPAHLRDHTPCLQSPFLYSDPALDVDMEDEEWPQLTGAEQEQRLAAKRIAETRAVAACMHCPTLESCRAWGLKMGDQVAGVVGALTEAERCGIPSGNPAERNENGQVRTDYLEHWAEEGILSPTEMAERLQCNPRTVKRHLERREKLADLAVNVTSAKAIVPRSSQPASGKLNPDRISPETAAIFDLLADGGMKDRNDIVNAVLHVVPRDVALRTAPSNTNYVNEDVKAAAGARKFLLNRIDLATRHGRISSVKPTPGASLVLISMEPGAAAVWNQHRQLLANAS